MRARMDARLPEQILLVRASIFVDWELLPIPAPLLAAAVLAGCGMMLAFVLYGARVGSRAAKAVTTESDS